MSNPLTNPGSGESHLLFAILEELRELDINVSQVDTSGPDANGQPPTKNPVFVAGWDGTNIHALKVDSDGNPQVDILTIAAGNNNIGDVDIASIAAGTNNIGDVDVASIAAGSNIIGNIRIDQTTVGTTNAFSLAQLGASTISTGNGGTGTGVQRVAQVSDGTGRLALIDLVTAVTTVAAVTAITNALPAGENFVGKIGGVSTVVGIAPTVDTAIYASGDLVGGKLSVAGATRVAAGTGEIRSIRIVDQDNEKAAYDVVFFEADPSGTTFTDQAALDVADADLLVSFTIPVLASDYVSFADNAIATVRNLAVPFKLASGTTLYAALVVRGTPTYTASTDIKLFVGIAQD